MAATTAPDPPTAENSEKAQPRHRQTDHAEHDRCSGNSRRQQQPPRTHRPTEQSPPTVTPTETTRRPNRRRRSSRWHRHRHQTHRTQKRRTRSRRARPKKQKQQTMAAAATDPPADETEPVRTDGRCQPAQTARGPEAARPDRTGLKTPARHTSERWRALRHGPRGANFADGPTRLIRGPAGAPSPFLSFFLSFFLSGGLPQPAPHTLRADQRKVDATTPG